MVNYYAFNTNFGYIQRYQSEIMKTLEYNPSKLEVAFAHAIEDVKGQIEKHLPNNEILKVENKITADNPLVKFYLLDGDGDPHELVIKVIQTPDKF